MSDVENPTPPDAGRPENLGILRSAPAALSECYDLGGLSPDVTLAIGHLMLRRADESLALHGRVFFSAKPRPAIRFEGTGGGFRRKCSEIGDGRLGARQHRS